jgi:hypothetical protein
VNKPLFLLNSLSCVEVAGIFISGREEPTTMIIMIISPSIEREKADISKLGREWYGNACLLKEKIVLIQNSI